MRTSQPSVPLLSLNPGHLVIHPIRLFHKQEASHICPASRTVSSGLAQKSTGERVGTGCGIVPQCTKNHQEESTCTQPLGELALLEVGLPRALAWALCPKHRKSETPEAKSLPLSNPEPRSASASA